MWLRSYYDGVVLGSGVDTYSYNRTSTCLSFPFSWCSRSKRRVAELFPSKDGLGIKIQYTCTRVD